MTYSVAYTDFWQLINLGLRESELLNASTLVLLPPEVLERVTHKTQQALKQVAALDPVLQVSLLEPLLARAQEVFYTARWDATGSFAGATGALQYYLYSSHAGLMYYLSNAKKVNQARVVVEKPLSGLLFLVANLLVSYHEWSGRVQLRVDSWVYAPASANLEVWLRQTCATSASGWSGLHTGGRALERELQDVLRNAHEFTPVSTHCKITYARVAEQTSAPRDLAVLQHYLQVLVPPALAASLTAIFPTWRQQVLEILTGADQLSHLYNSLSYARSTALRIGEQQLQMEQQRVLLQNYRKEFVLNRKEITQQVTRPELATNLSSYLRQQVSYWQLQQELLVQCSTTTALTYDKPQVLSGTPSKSQGRGVVSGINHQRLLEILQQSTIAWQTAQVVQRLTAQARQQRLRHVIHTAPALQQRWQQGQQLLAAQLCELEQLRARVLHFAQGERKLAQVMVALRESEVEQALFAELARTLEQSTCTSTAVTTTNLNLAATEAEEHAPQTDSSDAKFVGEVIGEVEEEVAQTLPHSDENVTAWVSSSTVQAEQDAQTEDEAEAIMAWDAAHLAALEQRAATELGWGISYTTTPSAPATSKQETRSGATQVEEVVEEQSTAQDSAPDSELTTDQEIAQRLGALLHRYDSEVQLTQQLLVQHQATTELIQHQQRSSALLINLQQCLSRVELGAWAVQAEIARKNQLRNLLRKEQTPDKLIKFQRSSLGIFLVEVARQLQARGSSGVAEAASASEVSVDGIVSRNSPARTAQDAASGMRQGVLFYPDRAQLKQHALLLRQAQGVMGAYGMEQVLEGGADLETCALGGEAQEHAAQPVHPHRACHKLSYLQALQLTATDRQVFTKLYQQELQQGTSPRAALRNLVARFSWYLSHHPEQEQDFQAAVQYLQQRQHQLRERGLLMRAHEQELQRAQREIAQLQTQIAREQAELAVQATQVQTQLAQLNLQEQTLSAKLATLTNNQILWSELRQRELQLREQLLHTKRQELALFQAQQQVQDSNQHLQHLRAKTRNLDRQLDDTKMELHNLRYDYAVLVEQLQMVYRYFVTLARHGVQPHQVLERLGVGRAELEQVTLPTGTLHES